MNTKKCVIYYKITMNSSLKNHYL